VRDDDRARTIAALRELGAAPHLERRRLRPPPPAAPELLSARSSARCAPHRGPDRGRHQAGHQGQARHRPAAAPGRLLFLFRIRFGLYAVLSRLGAVCDWSSLERGFAAGARGPPEAPQTPVIDRDPPPDLAWPRSSPGSAAHGAPRRPKEPDGPSTLRSGGQAPRPERVRSPLNLRPSRTREIADFVADDQRVLYRVELRGGRLLTPP
jgi:hypothetical protein